MASDKLLGKRGDNYSFTPGAKYCIIKVKNENFTNSDGNEELDSD
jgi:hypothetical protein